MEIVINFKGRQLEFHLDDATGTWKARDPAAPEELEDKDFPLAGFAKGKRYELYSDGTFAQVGS
ncbi:MAG: hypothetical protein WBD74_16080 [Candidatus Aquilonibacter sp.]